MKVKLLEPLDEIQQLRKIWVACRTCYSSKSPIDLWEDSQNKTKEELLKTILNAMESGHMSVSRHVHFTFAIEGISRACGNQLVRHTVGIAWEQQSLRYTKLKDIDFIEPDSIKNDSLASMYFDKSTHLAEDTYSILLNDCKIPAEDSRSVLPLSTPTNLVGTFSTESLINFCHVRLCTLAQSEIRKLAAAIRSQVCQHHPWLRPFLVIKCMADGYCTEKRNQDGHCTIRVYSTQEIVSKALKEYNNK